MSMSNRDRRLTLEQNKRLSKARVLGSGRALSVLLSDGEVAKILAVIANDTGNSQSISGLPSLPASTVNSYYNIPLSWFTDQFDYDDDIIELYLSCANEIQDFETYFECLCEVHKRRRKYDLILSYQPVPTMLQVAPRALLEFGVVPDQELATWISWRKWFYDIDNRAAQETGYLFEPILASALGGSPYGAKNSPIKRSGDNSKGRQVDCIVGRNAYEFKLRVTIAASGQGRFGEELDFARDCSESNFVPLLLVLDPTPSGRLNDLQAEFEKYGGCAYVGDQAWQHLEEESGPTMSTFIEKYVREPISRMDNYSLELLDLSVSANPAHSEFRVQIGSGSSAFERTLVRQQNNQQDDPSD